MKKHIIPNRYKCLMTLSATAFLISSASSVCNAAEVLPVDGELPIEVELPVEGENPIEEELPVEEAVDFGDLEEVLIPVLEENPQVKMLRDGQFPDVITYADPYETALCDVDAENDWKELLTQKYVDGLNNLATEIDISDLNIAPDNDGAVFTLIRDILNRSPQLFYARSDMRIWRTSKKIVKIDQLYSDPYVKADGSIDIPKLSRDKTQFMDRYNEAMSSINDQMTQMEKLLALHDWIVRECDYDIINYQQNTIPEMSFSARGVFLEGKAVCAGYAEAMAMCLNNAGIETVTVSSDAMNHAWNIVKLGNDYYHVDATWDDPAWTGYDQYKDQVNEGYTSHTYFIKSDYEMINECAHYGWNIDTAPKCNVSGSYANYPFRSYSSTNYTYSGGKWYYTVGDSIWRTDFTTMTSESQQVTEAETYGAATLLNAFTKDGALYYSTAKNVYKLDSLAGSTFELKQAHSVYRVSQKHPGYQIREFALKQGKLHVNGSNEAGGFFDDLLELGTTTLNGWVLIDGKEFWYEKGVRQGYDPNNKDYRGKEIYDPDSDAWYWLDNVQQGAKAVSKDVYQESQANGSGKIGKWVRYDANGHMVKGWDYKNGNTYYFDPVYGTMLKGVQFIEGEVYYFDEGTGILSRQTSIPENGWYIDNGETYWYKNGVREGYDPQNKNYRGKEIYDANTDAWYWLDNGQQGARAKNRDVYQESAAGPWAEKPAKGTGKWVRYDENGHMIKGWHQLNGNMYFFDITYGTMAKGDVTIDGQQFHFDPVTGILEN